MTDWTALEQAAQTQFDRGSDYMLALPETILALLAELREAQAAGQRQYDHAVEVTGRALRAEAERDAAREALRRYGRHDEHCEHADDVCGCGLDAALGQPTEPQP